MTRSLQHIPFRFGVVYLSLFVLATQISASLIPNLSFTYRGLGRLQPMRGITEWVAASVFGITTPLEFVNGEPLAFWIQTAWILAAAALVTAAWLAVDRSSATSDTLRGWFRLFIRLALAASLIEYGMTKVIPTQFPAPPLEVLVTPVGDLTLSALLWTSIGAAQPYEIATGVVEVLAGILLLLPGTTALGALVSLGALLQILALNMTYDVGLKLVTLHLIGMALWLLAPTMRALGDFFVRNVPNHASVEPQPARSRRGRRLVRVAPMIFGVYLLGMYAYINWSFWQVAGGGRPRSALYGIWTVEQLSVDGQVRPPEANDYDRRWRRVIFDQADALVVQRTDDSLARYGASVDVGRGELALTKRNSRLWKAGFTFERPSEDRLTLDGVMDGRRVEARLQRVDFDAFPLLHSRFRWVRPHD
jgi:uncharacterized membrane protein YphA (DoxX/SURF4 family)